MKFNKFMSTTVITTALLGVGTLFGINASADSYANTSNNKTIQNTVNTPNNPVAGNNGSTGTELGGNNSSIVIHSNTLTLESVPQLNFGQNSNNDEAKSGSNILPLEDSSSNNDSRKLEVTDYRKSYDGHDNNTWSLTASMGPVTQSPSDNQQNQQKTNQLWQINLANNPQNLGGSAPSSISNNTQLTSDSGNSGNDNGDQPIMSTNGNSNGTSNNGYGVNQIIYNRGTANLNIPNVAPGNYSTNITWKLNTTVGEQENNVNL